ncbi:hypothetical protein IAQ61_007492, partial [Plenodomus lingam]|uniref:uncharacterized protein n=1 Tax=Leptosphaeria maculans TaxID=5022 RepID=UPI00332FD9CE
MQPIYLLPLLPLLPTILATPILPPPAHSLSPSSNTTLLPRRPPLPENLTPMSTYYDQNIGCTFHTTIRQECHAGNLETYATLTRPIDKAGVFAYFDGRPTFNTPNVPYVPGLRQVGPRLWKKHDARFESTWFGDHMWYSYHGPSWSDKDPQFCERGEWTAGPLRCDEEGSLGWRTYDTDCVFKCIW